MVEMPCQELVELVTDYFEEALPPEDRARFEAHLANCGYCRRYVDQMQTTVRLVGKVDQPALTPAMREDVLTIFRQWKQAR